MYIHLITSSDSIVIVGMKNVADSQSFHSNSTSTLRCVGLHERSCWASMSESHTGGFYAAFSVMYF